MGLSFSSSFRYMIINASTCKGKEELMSVHEVRINVVRSVYYTYSLCNIEIRDETRLLYSIGLNGTYLYRDGEVSSVRATKFQICKERLTTVFCTTRMEFLFLECAILFIRNSSHLVQSCFCQKSEFCMEV